MSESPTTPREASAARSLDRPAEPSIGREREAQAEAQIAMQSDARAALQTDPNADLPIDLPEVLAEVRAAFARYEAALVANDTAVLDELFWPDARTVRYGAGENLYGIEAIRAFRSARAATGLARTLQRTQITTFGRDAATAMTLFRRAGGTLLGRQSQTWIRTAAGWRVVAAHVSLITDPEPAESIPPTEGAR